MTKIISIPLITLGALLWILLSYISQPLIIGEEVFERWNQGTSNSYIVGSIFTFKLLFTLMTIGAIGGFLASKFKDRKSLYITIQVFSTIAVVLYIYAIYTLYN